MKNNTRFPVDSYCSNIEGSIHVLQNFIHNNDVEFALPIMMYLDSINVLVNRAIQCTKEVKK